MVVRETEKFECIANYLKEKNLLEKNFKYFVQSEELDCDTHIAEIREHWLNDTLKVEFARDESSSEEDKDLTEFKRLYSENPECIHDQLRTLNYPDVLMQIYIYKKSRKTSFGDKKRYLSALEDLTVKKLALALTMCFPDMFFGLMFDGIFKEDEEGEVETLEEKRADYCITKYVVDNKLIDTNAHTIDLNPFNIDTSFDCTDYIEDLHEESEETITIQFVTDGTVPRRQVRCMNRVIRLKQTTEYLARLAVLSDVKLGDEEKSLERVKFIEFMKPLYDDVSKCLA